MIRRLTCALLGGACLALLTAASAVAHDGQHGPLSGHLLGTGAFGNLALVSKLRVHDAANDVIADLTVFKNFVYLARFGAPDCAGPETGGQGTPDGGAYVVDISNPAAPREVAFIATSQDTNVGEGMQALTLTTSKFSGDVLVMNHEGCGKNFKGGFSLWDVTNPLSARKLSEHAGDFTTDGTKNAPHDANQYHSAFAWDAGERAFLMATDDDEATDVDIFDITDPRKPVLVSETNLNPFGIQQLELGLTDSFLHDMVVKQIGSRFIGLLSYWDGGYILLDVTNPAAPEFLGDSDFAAVDPELLAQTGTSLAPEGNGHQAEFTLDNRFAITTDEDFAPFRVLVTTADGTFRARTGSQTRIPQAELVSGTTVFVGRACTVDAAVPPAPAVGMSQIAVVERGLCTFQEKALNVISAGGYEALVFFNSEGSGRCTAVVTPSLSAQITTLFIGRDSAFAMFNTPYDQAACEDATILRAPLAIGTIGDPIQRVSGQFDGWGYVHLFAVDLGATSGTLTELDTFAIPEAMDPAFATGFGDLSVHEVATDKTDASRAYLSYYAGGIRALQIRCQRPRDISSCRLVETGGYLDPHGNDVWGIETFVRDGVTYVAGSDLDFGLFLLRRK